MENIKEARVEETVEPLVKTSEKAARQWKDEIGLLWIDGAHEYDYVKSDFESWSSYLVKGGVVAFHDTTLIGKTGPYRVVKENVLFSDDFSPVKYLNRTTYAVHCKKSPSLTEKIYRSTSFFAHVRKHQVKKKAKKIFLGC